MHNKIAVNKFSCKDSIGILYLLQFLVFFFINNKLIEFIIKYPLSTCRQSPQRRPYKRRNNAYGRKIRLVWLKCEHICDSNLPFTDHKVFKCRVNISDTSPDGGIFIFYSSTGTDGLTWFISHNASFICYKTFTPSNSKVILLRISEYM